MSVYSCCCGGMGELVCVDGAGEQAGLAVDSGARHVPEGIVTLHSLSLFGASARPGIVEPPCEKWSGSGEKWC